MAQPINDTYKYGFHKPENYVFKSKKGLDRAVVEEMSGLKNEQSWMRQFRLKALAQFFQKPMPSWGGDLAGIDFDNIYYYIRPTDKKVSRWEDLPEEIRDTYDRIGIPEAEKKFLSGVSAQYESEVVYKSIKSMLSKKGVVFLDMDSGLREYPQIVKQYFGTIIPPGDNKFAALNSSVWSGGSFVYVPAGVRVDLPLQAYFRINAANMGQFERTLIIAEEGSFVHYVEGCFLAGARVKTAEGEILIEKIITGNRVFTHKGRYKKVYRTMERSYKGKVFTIRYYGDSKANLQVTEEHPLFVCRRKKKEYRNNVFHLEWLRADEIKKDDYLVYPILHKQMKKQFVYDKTLTIPFGYGRHNSEKIFHISFDPDFYRLVGYFLSEGHIDHEHYLTFTFHIKEKEYLEDVKMLLHRYFGKDVLEGKVRNHGQTITLCSTVAARYFAREFGSTNRTKHIPLWILESPKEQLQELVKSMWRGDGSYDRRRNVFRYSSVTKSLVTGFRDILLQLGIINSINTQERISPKQTMHNVIISRTCNVLFGKIVGRLCKNGRKEGSPFYMDEHYVYLPIKSIKVTERETKVFNLSVEDDESYVAEGVVSHNCTAPVYTTDSLHSAVVEIVVKKGARVRYTTIQNWSNNVYNLVTKRARVEEEGVMEWVDGNLGCLAEGSTLTTAQGVKPIEAIKVGDKVLSWDEYNEQLCFQTVRAKRFSGKQPIYTVSVGERKLQVTANHPFYSYKYNSNTPRKIGRYKLGYVRADALQQAIIPRTSLAYGVSYALIAPSLTTVFSSMNQYAPKLQMTRNRTSKMHKAQQSTDELMWLFGYWVGDGNIEIAKGKTKGVIRFAKLGFSTPVGDRARQRLIITMTALVDNAPTERADGHHLAWNSKELVEFFRINGFTGNAQSKRVPRWVWSIPESQRLAFVAGYLDADGTVVRGRFSLKSVQRPLLEDIASLLVTLGITSRLYTELDQPKRVKIMGIECTAHGSYRLVFNGDERLNPWISSSLREKVNIDASHVWEMHRNVGRSNIQLSNQLEIVPALFSKASKQDVPTWDIEVEGTGNFVSQGFIVHNSKLTMKYPSVYLVGRKARGEILSIAYAGVGQHQDAGGKAVHLAPETTSQIISKSISRGGGRTSYRGLVHVYPNAGNSKSKVVCDALLLDEASRSDTYPTMKIDHQDVTIEHEATVSKIGDEQLFYLLSRGIGKVQAESMIVNGFIEPIVKELPLEYAVELNRLIQLQMEGSVG